MSIIAHLAPLTTQSSCLRCVSAAEHHTAEQNFKTGRTKPRKHLPRGTQPWHTRQDFHKMSRLWKPALKKERRCFSKVIFESNVTPNMSRSSDSFSTVPIIVNWMWLEMNCAWPGVYHSLCLTRIQFHLQRSHHSPTLPGSRFRDSAAVTLTHRDGTINRWQSGVIGITD